MRMLERNKRSLYYANPESTAPVYDEWGNETGDEQTTYTSPAALRANISAVTGAEMVEIFGMATSYSAVIVTEVNTPLVESSRLWVGVTPDTEAQNYNYIVRRVAKGLNSTIIAVSEVQR